MSLTEKVERSSLLKLKDSLSDAQSSTKKMLSKLERFEKRLGNLDSKISSIQTTTENYSRARENIGSVLAEVQKTSEYFRVAKEVESAIKAKFGNPTALLTAIERLTNAQKFFNAHEKEIKASGQALKTIDGLLKKGVTACNEELEKLLSYSKKSVEVVDDQSRTQSVISASAIKGLKLISNCLDVTNSTQHFIVYERVRVAQVLAELREHQTETMSSWDSLTQDVPYQRGNVHIHAQHGKDGTKPKVQNDFGSSQISKQSNLFLIRLDMFDIFMVRFEDMRDLCQPDVRKGNRASEAMMAVKSRIVHLCMDSVEQLLASTLDTSPSSSSLGNKALSKTNEDDQYTCDLQPISGNVLYCCKELMNFQSVYKRMYDLVLELKLDNPPDGPSLTDLVATLLGNVFKTLLKKAEYFDPVGKTRVSRSMNMKGHALFESGEKDGDDYLQWARRHLFLSNNLFSLNVYLQEKKVDLKAYASSGSDGVGAGSGLGIESLRMLLQLADTVEIRLLREQEDFCEAVAGGLSFTENEMREFYEEYESANKTEKHRLLKSKFSLFNSGMDALLSQQGEWRVSSALLRDILGAQLLRKIFPLFKDFYGKYSKVSFSKKHMNEYLRFPPDDVDRALTNFFGKS